MPSFKKFYKEDRKKAIQSQKNSLKLLQLLMILCSYNFIKFSMCSYNFNVAFRISINRMKEHCCLMCRKKVWRRTDIRVRYAGR